MKQSIVVRITNYICAVLMLAVLALQFLPFWNCTDCKTHIDEDRMVSIAEYVWLPEHHKPISKDMTDLYKSLYGENIVDEYGKPYKFDADVIATELVIAFFVGILYPVVSLIFSRKALPLLLPLLGGIATVLAFMWSPALQIGQNWIVNVIVAGSGAGVALVGLVVGFISWAKTRGRYYWIPRRVPVRE